MSEDELNTGGTGGTVWNGFDDGGSSSDGSAPADEHGSSTKVTLKFVIAFPKRHDKDFLLASQMIEMGKKTVPSSKPGHYFHLEYYPFPGSEIYKIDCITYGLGAKVTHTKGVTYLCDEVVQVHSHCDVSWVVFHRTHYLDTMSDEALESVFEHKIEVRLCDEKSAVSNRSKHDKPKGFRMNNFTESADFGGFWYSGMVRDSVESVKNGGVGHLAAIEEGDEKLAMKSTRLTEKLNKGQKERFTDLTFEMSELYFDSTEIMTKCDMTNRLQANVLPPTWINFGAQLTLDRKLMTPEQERKYNPLLISFGELGPMPQTPIAPLELGKLCKPVYVAFECFGRKFVSRKVRHAETMAINSKHVVLTGRIPPNEIVETFRKGRFQFEIHDRDRKKLVQGLQGASTMFEKKSDKLWARLDQTKLLDVLAKSKLKHSCGVSYLTMTDFAKGMRSLNVTLPVLPKEDGTLGAHAQKSLPSGHYLDSCTELAVRVQLKYPYFSNTIHHIPANVFGIIIVISRGESSYLNDVKNIAVAYNNGLAQGSDGFASGFHVHCANSHYLTVEGPTSSIIEQIWNVPRPATDNIKVLYDSSMLFSTRQYNTLDRNFSRIRLNFDLEETLQNGLCHCQSFLPKVVLSAFIKLSLYATAPSLEHLYAADKVLKEEEVNSLKKDFESLFEGSQAFSNIMEVSLAALKKQKPQTAEATPGGRHKLSVSVARRRTRPKTVNT